MNIISGDVKWIDIVEPAEDDLKWVSDTFKLHPIIIKELSQPSARSRVEQLDGYVYFIYHFPVYDPLEQMSKKSEVDFIITKKEVVTVHYDNLESLHEFAKSLEDPEIKEQALKSTLDLVYRMVGSMTEFHRRQLSHIEKKVEAVSGQLFKHEEKKILLDISRVKRDILEFRVIIRPQEHLLRSLSDNGLNFWGETSRVYLNGLVGDHLKIVHELDSLRETLGDLEDTNVQLMNVREMETMRMFTILSFMTFPFVLFVGLFSMHADNIPIVGSPHGFWIIVAIIGVSMLAMIAMFKHRKWL
jgi:magnesium transporter